MAGSGILHRSEPPHGPKRAHPAVPVMALLAAALVLGAAVAPLATTNPATIHVSACVIDGSGRRAALEATRLCQAWQAQGQEASDVKRLGATTVTSGLARIHVDSTRLNLIVAVDFIAN